MAGSMPSQAADAAVQPDGDDKNGAVDRPPVGVPTHPEAGRIGQILVEDGLLSMEQLAKALRIQSRLEDRKPIGMLVVELGWVTRPRLELALRRHRHGLSVEGILVERGVIRAGQLAAAMEALKDHPNKGPGRHLVEIGAISERAYLEAYCEKHDLNFIDVDVSLVDRQLLDKVNLRYLTRHRIVPLTIQDGKLNVVLEQLGHESVLTELQRLYGVPVAIWIGESTKISAALEALAEEPLEGRVTRRRSIQYRRFVEASENNRGASEIVDSILTRAVREGASDIHVEPDHARLRVRFRIDGQLVRISEYPGSFAPSVISRIKVLADADIAERRTHQDGRIFLQCDGEDIDIRASFYVTVFGENAVLRVLRKANVLVGLEEMGFSGATLKTYLQDVLEPSSGALLVTGPTGSGKTTTLYASLQRLVDDTKKVITCEDPVEYLIDGVTQCSVADRPGMSFLDSLKAIVRQDPDIILVGEIRDSESADVAIHCALTGHKVLTTFHTEDSVGALVRLLQMNIEPFLIASTVTAVLAQRLLRRQCPHCRLEYAPTASEVRALSLSRDELMNYTLTRGRGCRNCHYTGYRGRIGVYELLVLNDPLRDALLQKRSAHDIRRIAQEVPGFVSLQEDGVAKALRGDTTLAEVAANCPRRPLVRPFRQLLEMYS
jgi:type IV pilus assembly protein PilB